jgi:hypothetical protein
VICLLRMGSEHLLMVLPNHRSIVHSHSYGSVGPDPSITSEFDGYVWHFQHVVGRGIQISGLVLMPCSTTHMSSYYLTYSRRVRGGQSRIVNKNVAWLVTGFLK